MHRRRPRADADLPELESLDGRPAFATPERFPEADHIVVGWPDEVAEEMLNSALRDKIELMRDFGEPAGAAGSRPAGKCWSQRLRRL